MIGFFNDSRRGQRHCAFVHNLLQHVTAHVGIVDAALRVLAQILLRRAGINVQFRFLACLLFWLGSRRHCARTVVSACQHSTPGLARR